MEIAWFILACVALSFAVLVFSKIISLFEISINTAKDNAMILELIKDYMKEYLKREPERFRTNLESCEQPSQQKPGVERSDPNGMESGPSEEDLAKLVSTKTKTAVSFGEDVSE